MAACDTLSVAQELMLNLFLQWEEASAREGVDTSNKYWSTAGLGGARVSKALERKKLIVIGQRSDGHMGGKLTDAGRLYALQARQQQQRRASVRIHAENGERS